MKTGTEGTAEAAYELALRALLRRYEMNATTHARETCILIRAALKYGSEQRSAAAQPSAKSPREVELTKLLRRAAPRLFHNGDDREVRDDIYAAIGVDESPEELA